MTLILPWNESLHQPRYATTRITGRGQSVLDRIDQMRRTTAESAMLPDEIFRNQLITIITRLGPTTA